MNVDGRFYTFVLSNKQWRDTDKYVYLVLAQICKQNNDKL